MSKLDAFTRAYIKCALWSSNDESTPAGGESLDANYDIGDLAPSALDAIVSDCARFQAINSVLLADAYLYDGMGDASAGHDFWLTRNQHGAGFWDGDYPATGDKLTTACRAWCEVDLYVGGDGLIYQAGSET